MCTILNTNAKERTTYGYKVVRILYDEACTSVFNLFYWKKGKNIAEGLNHTNFLIPTTVQISKAFFHAFTNKREAIGFVKHVLHNYYGNLGVIKVKMIKAKRGISTNLCSDLRYNRGPALVAKEAIWDGKLIWIRK